MKKRILTVVVGILCAVGMHGQSSGVPSLPQLATPSPKATMIDRFGYYPTNLYTGLVDITIPIHTIEVKGIKIPIEFKYHASGLKYDDLPMEVGYGWTLMAGGTVSYSARGAGISRPVGTELPPFVKEVSDIVFNDKSGRSDSDQLQLEYVENGNQSSYQQVDYYRDSEYDVYNFTFPGHSGQHYAMNKGDNFSIPSTLTLEGDYYPRAHDEEGNVYYFEYGDSDDYDRNRTYYLTRIVSADGKETVNFTYKYFGVSEANDVSRPILNYFYVISETTRYGGTVTSGTSYGGGMPGISYKKFRTPVLAEISSSAGKVKFYYSGQHSHSLTGIDILGANGTLLRTVTLDKTDDAYLDAVNFCTPTGSTVYSYRLEYNGKKPEGNVSIDYWGYYNSSFASSANQLYVPDFTVPRYGFSDGQKIPGMDRTPNPSAMQLGILKKITYPTRGYSEFAYEAHRADNQTYGGLRIAGIKNYDSAGNLQESKWYKYGNNDDGNGRAIRRVDSYDYMVPSLVVERLYNKPGEPIDGPGDRILSKTYYPFPKCSYFAQGSSVVYPVVTEYVGSLSGAYGSTKYVYTDFPDYVMNRTWRGYKTEIPLWSYAWKSGKLLQKTVRDGNGHVVYSLENVYEETNRKDHLNLKVNRYAHILDQGATLSDIEHLFSAPLNHNYAVAIEGSLHDYYNYYITSGEYAVKESREMKDGVTRIACYRYNDLGQIVEESLAGAGSDTLTTCYRYPYDAWKDGTDTPVQYAMFQKYMFAPLLTKRVYRNGLFVDEVENEYKDWGDFIALQNVKQLNYYEPRIKYQSYDKYGNPTRISKDGEFEDVSYIWGYKGQRVVAEIRGGSFSALGQTLIDRVTSAVSPSSADMAAIEALRNNHSLDGSRITTYYYDSALNLEQLVMPNGTKTNYEYDSFGRLSCVKDHNGKVIESYQYNYKQ